MKLNFWFAGFNYNIKFNRKRETVRLKREYNRKKISKKFILSERIF